MKIVAVLAVASLMGPPPDDLARRAEAIKPSEKELAWLGIPWVLDLMEAQQGSRGAEDLNICKDEFVRSADFL